MSSISPGLSTPSSSFVWKNITVDETDSSLKFSQGWNRSESSAAHGGSFLAADGVGDRISFSLPVNAVSVYYFGFKQPLGAFYDACLDCQNKVTSKVDAIDGHSNEPHSSEPTLLYYKTNLDPNVHHTLDLLNLADARFQNSSTITVDSFIVTILEEETLSSTSASSATHSTSASESATMSSMNVMSLMAADATNIGVEDSPPTETSPSPSATSSTTSSVQESASGLDRAQNQNNLSSAEASAQKLRSPLLLTGLILASLFVVCTSLYALMYFMRRRKRRRTAPVLGEGHWATRFFGEKGRGSVWIGNMGRLGAGMGGAKVAKGAMIEKLVPDKPLHASLPSRPNIRASTPPRQTTNQWVAPAYNPYNTSQAAVSTRTVPRSAFPSSTNPPGLQMHNGQVTRGRSASEGTNPMYTGAPSRTPSAGSTYSQAQLPMMPSEYGDATNPYVVEARARVRDRARGANDGGWPGPAVAQVNPFSYGYGNGEGNEYGNPGPPWNGYGYGPPGAEVNRDGSWGRRYGQ